MRARPVGVRYNPDTAEFELRCDDCRRSGRGPAYWPLTVEFWTPKHGMTRCNACHLHRRAARLRERLHNDPDARERKRLLNLEQKRVMGRIWEQARRERVRLDPVALERRRERTREGMRRWRAKQRAQAAA